MSDWWAHDHKPRPDEQKPSNDRMLWTLTKNGHGARAVAREIAGVGIEVHYLWDDELRQSQVYRNSEELAEAARAKRDELIANGWTEVPRLAWGN